MHPFRHAPKVTVPARTLAFWTAVLLPALYIPMVLGGFERGEIVPFVGLVAAHAVALSLGHGHEP